MLNIGIDEPSSNILFGEKKIMITRSLPRAAFAFNLLIAVFMSELVILIGGIFLPWLDHLILPLTIALIFSVGFLAYQIEYHPIWILVACALLFVPFAGLAVFLVLFFQAKAYLRKKNYTIGLIGAKSLGPVEDTEKEIDRLIKEGKIKMKDTEDRTSASSQ